MSDKPKGHEVEKGVDPKNKPGAPLSDEDLDDVSGGAEVVIKGPTWVKSVRTQAFGTAEPGSRPTPMRSMTELYTELAAEHDGEMVIPGAHANPAERPAAH